jgi:hypothetical protein
MANFEVKKDYNTKISRTNVVWCSGNSCCCRIAPEAATSDIIL